MLGLSGELQVPYLVNEIGGVLHVRRRSFHMCPQLFLCYRYRCQDLTDTMRMVCEIITSEPAGGSAAIPYATFERIYKYLATADGSVSGAAAPLTGAASTLPQICIMRTLTEEVLLPATCFICVTRALVFFRANEIFPKMEIPHLPD